MNLPKIHVIHRGLSADIEPADLGDGSGPWEIRFGHQEYNDWRRLRAEDGTSLRWPEDSVEVAQAAAIRALEAEREPLIKSLEAELVSIRLQLERLKIS